MSGARYDAVVDFYVAGNERAREAERDEPLGVRYLNADVTEPGVLAQAAFDAATCNFGLSDIDDLAGAIGAVGEALRAQGRWLDEVAEPLPPADWDKAHEADRTPVFLAARAMKMGPSAA